MTVSFSANSACTCDTCSNPATYGFFISQGDDPDSEIFLCTGCAQRGMDRQDLEDAIEDHRQVCFDRAEAAQREVDLCDDVMADWLCYIEEEIAC
jgi:hypothetical protein